MQSEQRKKICSHHQQRQIALVTLVFQGSLNSTEHQYGYRHLEPTFLFSGSYADDILRLLSTIDSRPDASSTFPE